ncbi:MAG: hypothetical protein L6R28_19140 [Planctomycetes bacterium]|nr:hypothetical protein [Planctomycetota bacterium]
MPPPRRSSRIDLRPPTPQGSATPALDTAPDLAADDLRRSGSAGLLLLAVGAAVFGLGVGLLGIPVLMGGGKKAERKRSAKESEAPANGNESNPANGSAGEAKEPPEAPGSLDASKLYPHKNLLPAGLLVPPPEAKTPDAADVAKTEAPQVAEAKTPAVGAAESKNAPAVQTPDPAAQSPVAAGPFRLVTFNGFDERKAQGWKSGSFTSDPTFRKSPAAWAPEKLGPANFSTLLRAADIPTESASGQAVPNFGKRGDGYLLNLQVYTKDIEAIRLDLMDGASGVLGDLKVGASQLKDGDWTELHLELDKTKPAKDAKLDAPVVGLRLTFLGDKSKKGATTAAIDDASVTVGGSSAEAAKAAAAAREKALADAEKAAQAEALKQALTGDPGKDGFLLGPEILDTYKRLAAEGGNGAAKRQTKAKEIARLVSGGAGSASFLVPLGAKDGDLKEADGYTWRAAGPAVWRDPAGAAREVERYLADGNPEILVLAADPEEVLTRRKHPYEYFAELSCAVDAAMKRGVLPVLVSPMEDLESAPEKSEKRARIASVRKLVAELGEARRIPVLDAGALLDEKAFANGRVQPAGYQKLNEAFLKLYRKLEQYVLPREGVDRSAAPKAGLPGLPGLPAGPAPRDPKESKPVIGVED